MPECLEPPLSRREQKRIDTHTALVNAAMALLSTTGFDATTVDEIAAEAGISRRTLFRYFPTKADIVTAWTEQMTAVLTTSVTACPASYTPQMLIAHALESVVPHMARSEEEAFAFVCLIERTPALLQVSLRKYATWEESLTQALIARMPTSRDRNLQARVASRSGIAAFRTALDEWICYDGNSPLIPIIRHVMALQHDHFRSEDCITAGRIPPRF